MLIRHDRLDAQRGVLVVIDVQEKLLPLIEDAERVTRAVRQMARGAALFEMPIVVTEQYPKGLGATVEDVLAALPRSGCTVVEKPTFSACGHDPIRRQLLDLNRDQVVLVGIEAHVCVQQTALDLRLLDYDVFVCADGVGSRGRLNYDMALARMRQAGAFVTTVESVLFEACERCDAPRFRKMLDIIKADAPR